MEKIKNWYWERAAQPLARRLMGQASRRPWLFRLLQRVSPRLLNLVLLFEELDRPANSLLWWYGPDLDPDGDPDGLVAEVGAILNQAATPLGADRFQIVVNCLGWLEGETEIDADRLDRTLNQRPRLGQWQLQGQRWTDWKTGQAPTELRAILQQASPTRERPAVVIQAAVIGQAYARVLANFNLGQPGSIRGKA